MQGGGDWLGLYSFLSIQLKPKLEYIFTPFSWFNRLQYIFDMIKLFWKPLTLFVKLRFGFAYAINTYLMLKLRVLWGGKF